MNKESSAYLLCDLGISHHLAKKLYDNGIKINDIKNNSNIVHIKAIQLQKIKKFMSINIKTRKQTNTIR